MAEYRLYGMGESGNAYKAALMLNLCQLDWEATFVDFFHGEQRSDRYLTEVNELGDGEKLQDRHLLDGRFAVDRVERRIVPDQAVAADRIHRRKAPVMLRPYSRGMRRSGKARTSGKAIGLFSSAARCIVVA